MPATDDEQFMQMAIELAMLGRGLVEPNPMVGCVIVKEGRIIGRGFHERFGGPHAEPNALASCSESPAGATAYVTLEPCCHIEKKTPPCVPTLIAAKFARVVVGCLDPNPQVSGRGVQQLREAGITVDIGICGDDCRQLIAPFVARIRWKRPYVTLKWAQTTDGKIAGPDESRLQISGPIANRVVHGLRGRCDAIVVGINTVLNDDPLLTARDVPALRKPLRVVLDSNLRIPLTSNLVRTARETPVIIYTANREPSTEQMHHADRLREFGVQISALPEFGEGKRDKTAFLVDLANRGCTNVLVEPGPTLASNLLTSTLADRVWQIRSKKKLCEAGVQAAAVPNNFQRVSETELGDDTLTEFLNTQSDSFAAAVPSADFHIASGATFANQGG